MALIACCVFYLAWWVVAFHPTRAIRGFKSGWLLIPAFIFAALAIWRIARGVSAVEPESLLVSNGVIIAAGIISYIVLLLVTSLLFKRMVTSELIIITAWTFFMFAEISALYGVSLFTKTAAFAFTVMVLIAAFISLVCYVLFYNLDEVKGYIDGMIPLLAAGIMTAAITVGAAV